MTPNQYQELAGRTICPQNGPGKLTELGSQVLHSVVGLQGESGELASAIEKWLWYNQDLDDTNLIEEFGDCLWYIAEGLGALGVSLEDCMQRNISKLEKRFPDKYSDEKAAEKNRDRATERKILEQGYKQHCEREAEGLPQNATIMREQLEQTGQGWEEPPEDQSQIDTVVAPVEPSVDKYGKYKDPNYSWVCKIKGCNNKIHKTNSVGICPACWKQAFKDAVTSHQEQGNAHGGEQKHNEGTQQQ